MDSARESELTPPLRSHPSGTARIEQSEKYNRGRRMDLVLGLSEEGDEESSGEDEYDDSHGQGSWYHKLRHRTKLYSECIVSQVTQRVRTPFYTRQEFLLPL